MMELVRIELFKFRTQRAQLVIVAVGLALTLLGLGMLWLASQVEDAAQLHLSTPELQRQILGGAGTSLVVLILAIFGMTSEFRHGTIDMTLRGDPNRARVVVAKAITYGLIALAYGIGAAILNQIGARIVLGFEDIDIVVANGTIARDVARNLAALVLYTGFGLGIAAIVANQVAAILIVVLEPFAASIAMSFLPSVARYLPSQAQDAFTRGGGFAASSLSEWTGAAVFLCYVAASLAAGIVFLSRRDIT